MTTEKGRTREEWCEHCAGLGHWWEGPLGQRVHVVCQPCNSTGLLVVHPPENADQPAPNNDYPL